MAEENSLGDEIKAVQNLAKEAQQSIFDRDITPTEFYYLLGRYPYLEIANAADRVIDPSVAPEQYRTKTGWQALDFGNVLIIGSSELQALDRVHRKARAIAAGESIDEGDEGSDGTIVGQYAEAAFDLINIAIGKQWPSAEIISGYYPMRRMAWIAAAEVKFSLYGFEPTTEDRVVQNWAMKLRDKKLYPKSRPDFIPTDASGRRI